MKWLRLYNDAANDPNWRIISDESSQPVHAVMAVWFVMLCHASEADPRGTLSEWNDRRAGAMTGLSASMVADIRAAMQGITLDGNTITAWEREQYESDTSAARSKQYRERKKQGRGDGASQSPPVASQSRDCDAPSRDGSVTASPLRATDSRLQNDRTTTTGDASCDASHAVADAFLRLRAEHWPDDPSFPAPVMTLRSQAQGWIDEGLNADAITDVMRKACRNKRGKGEGPPTCLGFVKLSLRNAVSRAKPSSEVDEGRPTVGRADLSPDEAQWRSRLSLWLKGIDWQWGAAPDRPGTKVPATLLAEFADAIRQRDAKVEAR